MTRILLAGRHLASLPAFKRALEASDTLVTCLDSGREALSALSENDFDLLIADESLDDMTGLDLITSVVSRWPMLNCSVVSSLSAGDFHEASEGLGILMQLPENPGAHEARELMKYVMNIQSRL